MSQSIKKLQQDVAMLKAKFCCGRSRFYDTFEDFPTTGSDNVLYVDKEAGSFYIWNGSEYVSVGGGENSTSLQGFDSMDAAIQELGLGKQFYYVAANLDGATAGSIHITI
jgi:hypothetical protein